MSRSNEEHDGRPPSPAQQALPRQLAKVLAWLTPDQLPAPSRPALSSSSHREVLALLAFGLQRRYPPWGPATPCPRLADRSSVFHWRAALLRRGALLFGPGHG